MAPAGSSGMRYLSTAALIVLAAAVSTTGKMTALTGMSKGLRTGVIVTGTCPAPEPAPASRRLLLLLLPALNVKRSFWVSPCVMTPPTVCICKLKDNGHMKLLVNQWL